MEWISIKDRMPTVGQIVDVWQMPSTQSQERRRGLENSGLFAKHEFTGWRSTNYKFEKVKEGDEELHVFRKVKEGYLCVHHYPNYKELCVENGEVTFWMPLPIAPIKELVKETENEF